MSTAAAGTGRDLEREDDLPDPIEKANEVRAAAIMLLVMMDLVKVAPQSTVDRLRVAVEASAPGALARARDRLREFVVPSV